MTACLEARSSDQINSGLLKNDRFIGCCRSANRNDSLCAAFVENFPGGNSVDETENGHFRVDQDPHLVLESDRAARLIGGKRSAQILDMSCEVRETAGK